MICPRCGREHKAGCKSYVDGLHTKIEALQEEIKHLNKQLECNVTGPDKLSVTLPEIDQPKVSNVTCLYCEKRLKMQRDRVAKHRASKSS